MSGTILVILISYLPEEEVSEVPLTLHFPLKRHSELEPPGDHSCTKIPT